MYDKFILSEEKESLNKNQMSRFTSSHVVLPSLIYYLSLLLSFALWLFSLFFLSLFPLSDYLFLWSLILLFFVGAWDGRRGYFCCFLSTYPSLPYSFLFNRSSFFFFFSCRSHYWHRISIVFLHSHHQEDLTPF